MQNAILVMESRGIAPGVRSFSISDAWTRLYRTEDFFLDLSYSNDDGAGQLLGQVLSEDGALSQKSGTVTLRDAADQDVTAAVNEAGEFKLLLGSAQRGTLHLELGDERFNVPDFDAA